MKIISFSAIEILPSLLSKEKVQTIRPQKMFHVVKDFSDESLRNAKFRFKVGESVKLLWKCRSKYQYFCTECGQGIGLSKWKMTKDCSCEFLRPENLFSKLLGTGIINSVFKIEMGKTKQYNAFCILDLRCETLSESIMSDSKMKHLAKLDGFKNLEDMFNYFDKNYSLDIPKRFVVYRWSWD